MVEVVGLTISFLVAVEAVGTISLTAEVGRSPWGSMGQFIYDVSTSHLHNNIHSTENQQNDIFYSTRRQGYS